MKLQVDERHLGTSESAWMAAFRATPVDEHLWGTPKRVVVVAPHPDDEVLALGGSLMRLARRGARIAIVAVTRGESSHPRSRSTTPAALANMRNEERERALAWLGIAAEVTELDVPDGRVAAEVALAGRLAPYLRDADLCVAPWANDGHPDHDATGLAAREACLSIGIPLREYVVWGWHWARPWGAALPWARLRRISLAPDEHLAKLRAIEAYRSQLHPLAPDEPRVILPPHVLARFRRPFETVLT